MNSKIFLILAGLPVLLFLISQTFSTHILLTNHPKTFSKMAFLNQPIQNTQNVASEETSSTDLIRFDGSTPTNVWQIVNDTVMGGRSRSRLIQDEGFARFEGNLSLENNGGFASVRLQASQPVNLSSFNGIGIKTKGDSRVYHFRIKTVENGRITNYSWESAFRTTENWNEFQLPFSSFKPVFRGRNVRNASPLDTSKIIEIGIMIKDGRQGSFSTSIEKINAYTD